MAKGRRAKPYVKGPRKQMTMAWKRLVVARLAENERSGKQPANTAQLAKAVGSDKRGMYVTLDLDLPLDEQQMSSAYVDAICDVLKIGQPLVESSDDRQLEQDVAIFRQLDAETRSHMLALALKRPGKISG